MAGPRPGRSWYSCDAQRPGMDTRSPYSMTLSLGVVPPVPAARYGGAFRNAKVGRILLRGGPGRVLVQGVGDGAAGRGFHVTRGPCADPLGGEQAGRGLSQVSRQPGS